MFVKYADGSMIPKLEYPKRALNPVHLGSRFPKTSSVRFVALARTSSLLSNAGSKQVPSRRLRRRVDGADR